MKSFEELYSLVNRLPIIDWHNHLDLNLIAADRPLGSLYEVWVKADPYKHRAMRICGESERLITGDAPESEKWAAWMRTLPKLVGNPVFAWAKQELEFLGLDAAKYLRGEGENISLSNWTPSRLLRAMNVECICPCVGAGESSDMMTVVMSKVSDNTGTTGILPVDMQTGTTGVPPVGSVARVRKFPDAISLLSSTMFSSTLKAGEFHQRNLPHLTQHGRLTFVTFRLADSLPLEKLQELASEKKEWLEKHPEPWTEEVRREYEREVSKRIDKWLDAGYGSCILMREDCRKIVESALEFFNDDPEATGKMPVVPVAVTEITGTTGVPPVAIKREIRYRLHGYIVMPNHVHVLLEVYEGNDIAKIVGSWKSYTAKELNRCTGGTGKVWKDEYFDRLIRDERHYRNVLAYLDKNGAAAEAIARRNGRDARCPSDGDVNGQDARCPSVMPSLRMNAGDVVSAERLGDFEAAGCRVVDISVDDEDDLERHFESLVRVAGFAAEHGWTMLLHLGALRETSARLRAVAGPAGGYAGMRTPVDPAKVARFLNRIESTGTTAVSAVDSGGSISFCNGQDARCPSAGDVNGRDARCPSAGDVNGQDARCPSAGDANGQDARCPSAGALPRTILLSLNPEAHAQLAVLAGSFNEEGMPGKVQLGPAWWWCDHEEGIRDVLEKNAAYGVLSTFVGMTTDSRSLLSFVRHDYFRRILCQWAAEKVAAGAFPDDETLLRPMLEGICYFNAREIVK